MFLERVLVEIRLKFSESREAICSPNEEFFCATAIPFSHTFQRGNNVIAHRVGPNFIS